MWQLPRHTLYQQVCKVDASFWQESGDGCILVHMRTGALSDQDEFWARMRGCPSSGRVLAARRCK